MRFQIKGLLSRSTVALAAGASLLGLTAATAPAAEVGGVGAAGKLAIADVVCVSRCVGRRQATPGAKVRVRGLAMDRVTNIVFRGGKGPIGVKPLRRTESAALARVPRGAVSGRTVVVDSSGERSAPAPRKLAVLPPSAIPKTVFPVAGPHQYWDGFGAGRHHQGVDVGARCRTPVVAAMAGRISFRDYEGAAGNYVVIDVKGSNAELGYMHLIEPAHVRKGQFVNAGQPIGFVGETGRATGCHLHFEYWIGRWWRGGSPVDPMPYLKRWDRATAAKRRLLARRARRR